MSHVSSLRNERLLGAVAQPGEHRLCKPEVVGSNPTSSTSFLAEWGTEMAESARRMSGLSVLWPEATFRAGIFCSGKERKLAATGAYQDIRDRDASAAQRRRNKKDQAETGL